MIPIFHVYHRLWQNSFVVMTWIMIDLWVVGLFSEITQDEHDTFANYWWKGTHTNIIKRMRLCKFVRNYWDKNIVFIVMLSPSIVVYRLSNCKWGRIHQNCGNFWTSQNKFFFFSASIEIFEPGSIVQNSPFDDEIIYSCNVLNFSTE